MAIDADSKLIVSWFVGNRDYNSTKESMQNVALRLANSVQLTTDGHKAFLNVVDDDFDGEIDFFQLIKIYGQPVGYDNDKSYSPVECTDVDSNILGGRLDEKYISSSNVEPQYTFFSAEQIWDRHCEAYLGMFSTRRDRREKLKSLHRKSKEFPSLQRYSHAELNEYFKKFISNKPVYMNKVKDYFMLRTDSLPLFN